MDIRLAMSGREERRREATAEKLDTAVEAALADPEALGARVHDHADSELLAALDLALVSGPCLVVTATRLAQHFRAYGYGGLPPSLEERLRAWVADDYARREGWS